MPAMEALLGRQNTMCMCSFGAGSAAVTPTPLGAPVLLTNMPAAIIQDTNPPNLTPQSASFNMCNSMGNPAVSAATSANYGVLTPQTCTPAPAGPWTPADATVLINNQPPILRSGATRACSFGGPINTLG